MTLHLQAAKMAVLDRGSLVVSKGRNPESDKRVQLSYIHLSSTYSNNNPNHTRVKKEEIKKTILVFRYFEYTKESR